MSPFEVLYGRRSKTPINWLGPKDKLMLGLEMLQEIENTIKKIRGNLKTTQDKKKSYVDKNKFYREFMVGDYVYV